MQCGEALSSPGTHIFFLMVFRSHRLIWLWAECFLEQRSLATARQVPARCWVKLWWDLVTNQIYKLRLCCSVKDTAQARWLASTWSNRVDYWEFLGFFFSMLENKSSCFTSCSNESHLLRTRSSCHLSPNFCCSSFTGLCAREGILAISCLHANIR